MSAGGSGGLYVGLDLGTQGVRCLAVDDAGEVVASAETPLPPAPRAPQTPKPPPGWAEQDPEAWWEACRDALGKLAVALGDARPAAICVDSTSGTILPVDASGAPLRPALMYNDTRAAEEVAEVKAAAADFTARLGYGFSAAFALPKVLWLARHEPAVWERTAKVLHAADFVVSRLTGEARFSDWSDALKTGYDLLDRCWPDFLGREVAAGGLGLDPAKLPQVVAPGAVVGEVSRASAELTGLPAGLPVVAGCTDGTASLLASGASAPGQWNSTLGTTLAIRGVSESLVRDPDGRVYCHLHPDGYWLPGGAGNTGAGPLAKTFGEEILIARSAEAAAGAPYDVLVYPIVGRGERLPLACATAEGFTVAAEGAAAKPARPATDVARLGAWLQGQALVERWCFELVEDLGCEVGEWIAVTGGASRNDAWLQLRADVLGRQLRRPRHPAAAFGAALLAAVGVTGTPVSRLSRELIAFERIIDPRPGAAVYAPLLDRLKDETRRRWA